MEQRYVLFEEAAGPKVFKVPVSQTARLVNEYPNRKLQIFETLAAAKDAALAIVERTGAGRTDFSGRATPEHEAQRRAISELTEDRVERYRL